MGEEFKAVVQEKEVTAAELYEALTELQSSAAAYVQGLETENRRLREAVKPFAKEADAWSDRTPDDLHPSIDTFDAGRFGDYADFTIGDLRAARAALKDKS